MRFIGIDLHKHIFTVCVLDDNEKVVDEMIDIKTNEEGLNLLMSRYPSDDCVILFENLTRAHFAFHYLYERGYIVHVAHTGHGALRSITNTNLKTDKVDAYKLALVCKDLYSGRRFIRRTHISSDENMRMKAIVRLCNQYSNECEDMKLRVMEYMNLHNIPEHSRYKDVSGQRYMKYLMEFGDPALTSMVNFLIALNSQIETLTGMIDEYAKRSEDATLLMSIKGIGSLTAVTVVTAIDGIHRFDSPEKLVSYFGLAVCTSESAGARKKGHITKEGDPLVRKYLANVIVNHAVRCPQAELSGFYNRKKDEMPHWKAVTAAMRKLTCIIWAMLSYREPYHLKFA